MGSSEALFRATLNRISARLGHGLADVAAELAVLAQDVPDRLRQEWELFQDEVRAEAERLEHPNQAPPSAADQDSERSAQERIDHLRALVATISRELEEKA